MAGAAGSKPIRVVQWATGTVGASAMRAVIAHPDLELVGVRVYSEAKEGLDAGEICGLPATGVLATRDKQAIFALKPDCVLYMPESTDLDDVCRLLEGGSNIVSTRAEFFNPAMMEPAMRERVEAACQKGGSSIHCTGSSPGFITEALPIVLTSIARRLDHLMVDEFANCIDGCSEEMLTTFMGFGETPEAFAKRDLGQRDEVFEHSLGLIAEAIGLPLERFEVTTEVAFTRKPTKLHETTIGAGTVGGQRIVTTGYREGEAPDVLPGQLVRHHRPGAGLGPARRRLARDRGGRHPPRGDDPLPDPTRGAPADAAAPHRPPAGQRHSLRLRCARRHRVHGGASPGDREAGVTGRAVGFGYGFDLRNPEAWRRPWPDFYAETLDFIAWTESLGFERVWLAEHHGIDDGYLPSPLMVGAAIAARTERMRISTGVALAPHYHPVRLAEDMAVLDLISGGRAELALGIGYLRHEALGYGFSPRQRAVRSEEVLQIVRRLWQGETVSFAGECFQLENARVTPLPTQEGGIPLFVGAAGPKGLRRAARLGDGFIGQIKGYPGYLEEVRALGRDESSARFVCMDDMWCLVSEDPEKTLHEVAPHAYYQINTYAKWAADRDWGFEEMDFETFKKSGMLKVWTPDEAIEHVGAKLRAAPCEGFCMQAPAGYPLSKLAEHAELFASKVLPALR